MAKLLIKIISFSILIVLAQTWVASRDPKADQYVPASVQLANTCIQNKTDIIMFGDSTMDWHSPRDPHGKAKITDFLEQLLNDYTVGGIFSSGYQMEVFTQFTKYVIAKGHKPKIWIYPINMKSFSAFWTYRSFLQHDQDMIFLKAKNHPLLKIFYKPLSVFKFFRWRLDEDDFNQGLRKMHPNNPDVFKNPSHYSYRYELKPDHPYIKSLISLCELLKDKNQKAIFYFSPIDIKKAERLHGEDLMAYVEKNKQYIQSILSKYGMKSLDMTSIFPTNAFYGNSNDYTDHFRIVAKHIVAKRIAEEIPK